MKFYSQIKMLFTRHSKHIIRMSHINLCYLPGTLRYAFELLSKCLDHTINKLILFFCYYMYIFFHITHLKTIVCAYSIDLISKFIDDKIIINVHFWPIRFHYQPYFGTRVTCSSIDQKVIFFPIKDIFIILSFNKLYLSVWWQILSSSHGLFWNT